MRRRGEEERGEMRVSRSSAEDSGVGEVDISFGEACANGFRMNTTQVEAKLDEGNIHEAESSLRDGFSLNFEEARALLGRLEYQRGNVEGALRVFDGIDLQAAIQRLQPPVAEKPSRRGRSRTESLHSVSQHSANLVLEAIYLKAKSLQKLGRLADAAHECKSVLDAVEKIFYHGIPDVLVGLKLQETVSQAVELLPELWKQDGCYQEAMAAYRRALLSQWNLDDGCCSRIQKAFALFLLYSGVEAGPYSLAVQVDGSYVPRNNLEEAILLLMIILRNSYLGKVKWDSSVMEHLTVALSLCSQTSALAKQFEEVLPGIYNRADRWNALALCYCGAGQNKAALNLLRKSLHKHERPDDLMPLLLASKICSEDSFLAAEGVGFAQRAISNAQGTHEHLKGMGHHMLGLCLCLQAKASPSDSERSNLQSEALKSLGVAASLKHTNSDLIFDLGFQYAELRNMDAALSCTKQFIDATGGSMVKGWILLALVLSAEQRFLEAQAVIDAAVDETAKWEQGSLLRIRARLKSLQSLPIDAVETYRILLALCQAQRKSYGPPRYTSQVEDNMNSEFELWLGLATLYSSLSLWKDAQICLERAQRLKLISAEALHARGVMCEGLGRNQEALAVCINGYLVDPSCAQCQILLGALLLEMGSKASLLARSLLTDALRIEPTNHMAWYYLGKIHQHDGRIAEATECFQAASMLEDSSPVDSFNQLCILNRVP